MENTQKNMWKKNLTSINEGIFRSINIMVW